MLPIVLQECITLAVFSVIAYLLFGQKLTVNTVISYAFVVAAVYFAFSKDKKEAAPDAASSPAETTQES